MTEQTARDVSSGATELQLEIWLPFTVERAYEYWTRPELIARWWAPLASIEPRRGGPYRLSWTDQGWHLSGQVLRATPGAALTMTWHWEHEPDRPVRTVRVRFTPAEGGTMLSVIHGVYGLDEADQAERREHAEGWQHFLPRLAVAED